MPETPLVCASPHDVDDGPGDEDERPTKQEDMRISRSWVLGGSWVPCHVTASGRRHDGNDREGA